MRSIYAEWERGEFSSVEWADPAIEFVRAGEGRATIRGLAGMAEAWGDWLHAWQGFRAGAEEYRDLGGSVLVLNFFSGVGKTSGLEVGQVQTRGASVFHIREGKVTKLAIYADRSQALADLGLEE